MLMDHLIAAVRHIVKHHGMGRRDRIVITITEACVCQAFGVEPDCATCKGTGFVVDSKTIYPDTESEATE